MLLAPTLLAAALMPAPLAATVTEEFGGTTYETSVSGSYYGNIFDVTAAGTITSIKIPVSYDTGETSKYVSVYVWVEGSTSKYYESLWGGTVTADSTSLGWETLSANAPVSPGDRIMIGGYDYSDDVNVGYGSTNADNEPSWGKVVGTCEGSSADAPYEVYCTSTSGDADLGLEVTFVPDDADRDGYDSLEDCDDDDRSVNPDAAEVWYDGVDSDCDGGSDYDRDGDGYDSEDYDGPDCDDRDEDVYPRADDEPYDGVDADCAGDSDYDADGDGYDADAYGGDDCDDDDRTVSPDAEDEVYDGEDTNCDGASDYDADGDGFDAEEYDGPDCDDADPEVNPKAEERWYDGEDADCSGGSDFDQDGDGHDKDGEGGDDCDDKDKALWEFGEDGKCVEASGGGEGSTGGGCGDGICGIGAALVAAPALRRLRRRR